MPDEGCKCWGCRPDLMRAEYERLGLELPTEERDQAQRELDAKAGVIVYERERADHLQVTLDREIEQVQQLCAELAEANRRFDAAIAQRDIEIQANNRLCDELAEARQEAERMRPVVEAAKVWADRYDRGTYGMPGSSKRADYVEAIAILAAAVDALTPTPEPPPAVECADAPTISHGWTTHGHKCCDQATGPRPSLIARCGGPRMCRVCGPQAGQWHGSSADEAAREVAAADAKQLLARVTDRDGSAFTPERLGLWPERHYCSGCGKTGPIRHEGNRWTCEECTETEANTGAFPVTGEETP